MIVDAHHHVWTADYAWLAEPALAPIRRDYTVADLRVELAATGVRRTILVEAGQCSAEETRRFLALAASTPEIAGVVGWADPLDPDLAATIAAHRAGPGGALLVGLRSQVQAEGDEYLARPDVIAGLGLIADAGLVFDLVVHPGQLPGAVVAARALPAARFVLDHLGKPAIGDHRMAPWLGDVQDLAGCSNVVAKLSGLVTEADWSAWTPDDLRPYTEAALRLFGAERLLWGSDWPVVNLAGGYRSWFDVARALVPTRSREAIFGGNALRTYGLD